MSGRTITLDHIEQAFLESDYFPIRGTGNVVWATQEEEGESVIRATVRVREGEIVVEQVGTGKGAVAHAKRVAELFEGMKGAAQAAGLWTILVRGVPQPLKAFASSEDEAITRWRRQTKSRIARSEIKAEPETVTKTAL